MGLPPVEEDEVAGSDSDDSDKADGENNENKDGDQQSADADAAAVNDAAEESDGMFEKE